NQWPPRDRDDARDCRAFVAVHRGCAPDGSAKESSAVLPALLPRPRKGYQDYVRNNANRPPPARLRFPQRVREQHKAPGSLFSNKTVRGVLPTPSPKLSRKSCVAGILLKGG